MADSGVRRGHAAALLLLVILLVPLVRAQGAGEETKEAEGKQAPAPAERAIGITGLTSLSGRWDAIRTWAKLAWLNLRPPESWSGSSGASSGKVEDAAARSFEMSKETVEQTAASAAKVAGEAVHETKEKAKRAVSTPRDGSDEEL